MLFYESCLKAYVYLRKYILKFTRQAVLSTFAEIVFRGSVGEVFHRYIIFFQCHFFKKEKLVGQQTEDF